MKKSYSAIGYLFLRISRSLVNALKTMAKN